MHLELALFNSRSTNKLALLWREATRPICPAGLLSKCRLIFNVSALHILSSLEYIRQISSYRVLKLQEYTQKHINPCKTYSEKAGSKIFVSARYANHILLTTSFKGPLRGTACISASTSRCSMINISI